MPRVAKTILSLNLKGVHGIVNNLISVPEKYQIAVEIAAGNRLNDIVVDTDATAAYCIDYLKRERIGRATFLPLNKIKSRTVETDILSKKGVIGLVSRLIKYDKQFSSAVEFVFGDTIIVENLDIARSIGIGKVRMVTLDGDLIERSGAMIGGYLIRTHGKLAEKMVGDEIEEYRKLKTKLEGEINNFAEEIKEFEVKLKEFSKSEDAREFIDLEKLKVDSEKELDELRQRRKNAYEKRLMVQTDLNKLTVNKAKIEAELENVKIEVQQYGQVTFLDQGVKTLENGINTTMNELARLGAVNFKAIEQYETFSKEFDEYKNRYEKILEEKKAVLDMMEKIEQKRREVFYSCLKEVSQKFENLFQRMTKGSSSLELEDPMNLESGLLIQASPGGKTLLNIDSMSGGEKTLTALAFLFAVQEYRPAPFYILDEVDAALDKENSKKVAGMVREMSKTAQFIMITHNDTTIMEGDTVYGVTMAQGESKILGLELPKK